MMVFHKAVVPSCSRVKPGVPEPSRSGPAPREAGTTGGGEQYPKPESWAGAGRRLFAFDLEHVGISGPVGDVRECQSAAPTAGTLSHPLQ